MRLFRRRASADVPEDGPSRGHWEDDRWDDDRSRAPWEDDRWDDDAPGASWDDDPPGGRWDDDPSPGRRLSGPPGWDDEGPSAGRWDDSPSPGRRASGPPGWDDEGPSAGRWDDSPSRGYAASSPPESRWDDDPSGGRWEDEPARVRTETPPPRGHRTETTRSRHRWAESPAAVLAAPSDPLAEVTALALVAVGAALIIWAYRKATTSGINSYDPIFWAGMVLAYLAVGWRVVFGRYAVLWLWFLGVFTLLPKFWMSPTDPIYFDETAHFSLLRSVIASGRLFQFTPLLPIGKYYQGMESTAATIHWLTGLSPWDSALVLIAVVHSLLLVQVYYIARALQAPHRWAAVAGLVYATNPSFVYEDVQFAYESMAILLMLTIVRLYVEALAAERSGERTWRQSLLTSLLIAVASFACVVTHHLTSLAGIVLLLLGAFFIKPMNGFLDYKGGARRLFVRWTPFLTLGLFLLLWIVFVAPGTVGYLFPHVSDPTAELLSLSGIGHASKSAGTTRVAFSHSVAPGYERITAIAAPALIAIALVFVGIRWLSKRRLRSNFLWSFVVIATYLVSLPLTLTTNGNAGAHRTWATTYLGVCLLPAAIAILYELDKRRPWIKRAAVAAGAAVMVILLVGNVSAGTAVDYRFPGPYEFGSDTRSVTPETLNLARWVQKHLGVNARVITDRFTAVALTTHADAITPLDVPTLPFGNIWYNHRPPVPSLMTALRHQKDYYLAVDLRDAEFVPPEADLFYPGEPSIVPRENIARMAQWPWLKLVYASTNYRLYKINYHVYYKWYPANANGTPHKPKVHHPKLRHKKKHKKVHSAAS
jgi:hypothetical protein